MILVDSNIFMYAAGREHPHRARSIAFLEKIADGNLKATIDSEVLQEILHRYRSLKRWAEGRVVYDTARAFFRGASGHSRSDGLRASLLDEYPALSARER